MTQRVVADYCDPNALRDLAMTGDREALARVVLCHGERLLRVGHACCPECAEDAVQQALLTAMERLDGFEGRGSVTGWMGRLVVSSCHRLRRGVKNDTSRHVQDIELASPEGTDPESQVSRRARIQALLNRLAKLPPQHQELFLLSAVGGWRAPELAEHFGLSPGAVRTRLTRIRQQLRVIEGAAPSSGRTPPG